MTSKLARVLSNVRALVMPSLNAISAAEQELAAVEGAIRAAQGLIALYHKPAPPFDCWMLKKNIHTHAQEAYDELDVAMDALKAALERMSK